MSQLKADNVNQCLSILKHYVETSPSNHKKGIARLAIHHLLTITGGNEDQTAESWCCGRPRAEGSPEPVNG